ncbi:MAG: hypothetical protein ACC628_18390 [Pirellulaceae bacterium]
MNHRGWDIDRIVNEVLRRLQSLASSDDVASPLAKTTKAKTTKAKTTKERTTHNANELCLDERVVTLAAIRDRLRGIRHVRLCPKAVITPSARDEFRKRGIAVERHAAEPGVTPGNATLVIARADTNYDASALLRQVGGASIEASGLVAAVETLAERVPDDRQVGVLLTARTAPALCLANRHSGVRAALGGSAGMVRDAVQSMGANLLVIDPANRSLTDLANTLREFIRGGIRNCPAEFREIL